MQIKDLLHAAVVVLMAAVILNQLQVKLCASNRLVCHITAFHQLPAVHQQSSFIEQSIRSIAGRHFQKTTHSHKNSDNTTGLCCYLCWFTSCVFVTSFKMCFLSTIFNPAVDFV